MNNLSTVHCDSPDLISSKSDSFGTIPISNLPAAENGKTVAFSIPAYQRGYRWKQDDVTRLLGDLWEFLEEDSKSGCRPFYCLQPLVVKKVDKSECWEVVDGQQRLTTLFLIWKFLHDKPPYELSYDTRKRSRDFLNAPTAGANGKFPNIDFHHIYHAHQAIQEWFKDKEHEKGRFRNLLADTESKGRNVRFIWYELNRDDDAVAAFTRLNVGKIPLEDEELIRALFLQNGKLAAGAFQHRLALEWDRIETALQDPAFWGFVSNQPPPEGGRIRLLFKLCAPEGTSTKEQTRSTDHVLFEYYEKQLKAAGPENLPASWQSIADCFEQLDEWYRDPVLFHLIGFLTTIVGGNSVTTLRKLLEDVEGKTKSVFVIKLKQRVRLELIKDSRIDAFVSGLNFSSKQRTRQTLALFNIATLLRTKGVQSRFPFHLYHGNDWDIEHVHSQAGDGLGERKAQLEWLKACKVELDYEFKLPIKAANEESGKQSSSALNDLLVRIEEFGKDERKQDFSNLETMIRAYFGEDDTDGDPDGIGNLTLLDAPTNRGYRNAPFVVKRTKILKAERLKGTFILPCSRDLFLKVFSANPGNLRRWDIKKDGAAHVTAICDTLKKFFGEKEEIQP